MKELTIKPENEIRDHHGNLIKEIKMKVVHGTGQASGTSCISIELLPESAAPVEAGGWKIEGNKFVMIGGAQIAEDEATPAAQMVKSLNAYFAKQPEELEGLKNELQK